MNVIVLILLVFAFVFFVLAAIGIPGTGRFNLIAAGLACWVLTAILAAIPAVSG